MTPLLDENHPMYDEFKKERRKIVGHKKKELTQEQLKGFLERQKEKAEEKKEFLVAEHEEVLKSVGLPEPKILTPVQEKRFLQRIGPQAAERQHQEAIEQAERKINADLGFVPGGKKKTVKYLGKKYQAFLERQRHAAKNRFMRDVVLG